MKRVNVYDDGKLGRGEKADILKAASKSFLIRFYDNYQEKIVEGWFKKVCRKNKGAYWHKESNSWYFPCRETEAFRVSMKEHFTEEYCTELFNY